uniref:Uncharacterized protein n=1 Tax=Anguilla anguilla TaxID=7936 RepID=A0A0E9XUJ4_ANGAN
MTRQIYYLKTDRCFVLTELPTSKKL